MNYFVARCAVLFSFMLAVHITTQPGSLRSSGFCRKAFDGQHLPGQAVLKAAQFVRDNPFSIAAALWVAYYLRGNVLEFARRVGNNWLIAIPLGGIVLHRISRYILELSGQPEAHDGQYDFTINIHPH